jgi:hypothetical protein
MLYKLLWFFMNRRTSRVRQPPSRPALGNRQSRKWEHLKGQAATQVEYCRPAVIPRLKGIGAPE